MFPDCLHQRGGDPVREIQELEDAYAEALADEVDAFTLSNLWDEIKKLKKAEGLRDMTRPEECRG